MMSPSLIFLSITFTLFPVVRPQVNAPPNGKIWLGAWTQPDAGFGEFPITLNERIKPVGGGGFSLFQLSQTIPLTPYDPVAGAGGPVNITELEETLTDAGLFMTVYPTSLDSVKDSDLTALGNQILSYQQSLKRSVFLRFAPEMEGNWMPYGVQPTKFLSVWQRMYTTVKGIAPNTAIVWSPNIADGYPFGASLPNNTADAALLDTNKDGKLTEADDAYAPYYPGRQFVDWHGVSMYYKGPDFQNLNQVQPFGTCTKSFNGSNPWVPQNFTSWYGTYCNDTTKPCIMSESGAAYHVNITGGDSQADIQTRWINDCMVNSTFLSGEHPNLRGVIMFEREKLEWDGGVADTRDYRITNNTASLASFISILTANKDLVAFSSDRKANPNASQFLSPFINITTNGTSGGNDGTGSRQGQDSGAATVKGIWFGLVFGVTGVLSLIW